MEQNYFQMNFSRAEVNAVSNVALAYIGDAVFELLARTCLCARGDRAVRTLHHDAVTLVNAAAQARFADALLPDLSPDEAAYYRRGKNAHTHAAPKSATPAEYAKATGLEALFGALYLLGETERLNALFRRGMEALYGV